MPPCHSALASLSELADCRLAALKRQVAEPVVQGHCNYSD